MAPEENTHTLVPDAEELLAEGKGVAGKPSLAGVAGLASSAKAFSATPDVQELIKDASPLLKETKTGYKTTEFWGAIAAVIADLGTDISSKNKLIVSGIAALYALARGLAKSGVPTFER
jgi:hypothetical protein